MTRKDLHQCTLCSKMFRTEYYLDLHLDRRHVVNATDGLCLADACPFLGCPSYVPGDATSKSTGVLRWAHPPFLQLVVSSFPSLCMFGRFRAGAPPPPVHRHAAQVLSSRPLDVKPSRCCWVFGPLVCAACAGVQNQRLHARVVAVRESRRRLCGILHLFAGPPPPSRPCATRPVSSTAVVVAAMSAAVVQPPAARKTRLTHTHHTVLLLLSFIGFIETSAAESCRRCGRQMRRRRPPRGTQLPRCDQWPRKLLRHHGQ